MDAVLQMDAVGVRIGTGPERLGDVSLRLAPGDVATVAGPAAAGKTLLAEVAALGRRPSRGRLRLFGEDGAAVRGPAAARLRRRIGWVAAQPAWVDGLDAAGNAALPLRLDGMGEEAARARAGELLAWLGLQPMADASPRPARLRVALARAVLGRCGLLVVDEVGGCDPPLLDRLRTLVAELGRQGTAVLLTGRDPAVLRGFPRAAGYGLVQGRLVPADGGER